MSAGARAGQRSPAAVDAAKARLTGAGLRPTRQRLALAGLLFRGRSRHVAAESLHGESQVAGITVSLATVYNTLNQFTAAGLLKEVAVDSGRSLFDTNTAPHHHFFYPETGTLHDFPADSVVVTGLPRPPHGRQVAAVEIVVRLAAASGATSGVTARRGEAKAGRRKDF